MRVGVIGVGDIGKRHLEIYRELEKEIPGVKLCSFSKTTEEGAKKLEEELERIWKERIKSYGDYKKMLDKEHLNAISICSPAECHLENLEYAIETGTKLILCEKPLCRSEQLGQAKKLVERARAKGIVLAVNTQLAVLRRELEKIIRYSELASRAQFDAEWFTDKAGKDFIEDLLPHVLSLIETKVERIKEKDEDYVKIKARRGTITLGYSQDKRRNWAFYTIPYTYKFSYGCSWNEGKTILKYSLNQREKELEFEDPLKTSLRRFLQHRHPVSANHGLYAVSQIAKLK